MLGVKLKVTGLMLVLMLSGCGQKGPLYQEYQDESARVAAEASEAAPAAKAVGDDEDAAD